MSLISSSLHGWTVNKINTGPPFHTELTGPYKLPQVVDSRSVVALSGPDGAVFCASISQANQLCKLANDGQLNKQE